MNSPDADPLDGYPISARRDDIEEVLNKLADGFAGRYDEAEEATDHLRELSLAPGSITLRRISKADPGVPPRVTASRSNITVWSRKSRANLIRRLATLDYRPMFADGREPVMLTLTYPDEWREVAATAPEMKRHLRNLAKRYQRNFGDVWRVCWTIEWTARGTPHAHILIAPPPGQTPTFIAWVRTAWADVVGFDDPATKSKHARRGTHVSTVKGGMNPQRVAEYFAKHTAPGYSSKAYQKVPPIEWVNAGSIGRTWGYIGLKPLTVTVRISDDDAVKVARTLRRWDRSKRRNRKYVREHIDVQTGEITEVERRFRYRRRFPQPAGYITTVDAASLAADVLRALSGPLSSATDNLKQKTRGTRGGRTRTIQRRCCAAPPEA